MERTTKRANGKVRRATRGAVEDRQPSVEAGPPSEDAIRRRAYELYLERGGAAGRALDDWVRAERELRGRPA
jgi:hypothetical protein